MNPDAVSYLGFFLALFLPGLLGYVWVRVLWTRGSSSTSECGHTALTLGYGYLFGILTITFLLRAWDTLGFKLNFPILALLILTLSAIGGVLLRRRSEKHDHPVTGANHDAAPTIDDERCADHVTGSPENISVLKTPIASEQIGWQRLVILMLLIIIAGQFVIYGLDVSLRPLYPWDAWASWAHKARVWFAYKELVPFVSYEEWRSSGDSKIFTVTAYGYPPTIPLIQTWTALGLGRWDDSLTNLPWLLCGAALGLAFYGQARLWHIPPLPVVIAVYILLTLPFVGSHIDLAGYADLWLATVYCLAVMALLHWVRSGDLRQGILALFAAVAVTQIKTEGVFWTLTLLPAVLIAWLPRKAIYSVLGLLLAAVTVVCFAGGIDFQIPGIGRFAITSEQVIIPYLGDFKLGFFPSALQSVVTSAYVWSSWNLLWYLAPVALLLGLPRLRGDQTLVAAYSVLVVAMGFIALLFFFTEFYRWAEAGTALNRIILHLVPAMLFVMLIVFHSWKEKSQHRLSRSSSGT